MGLLDVRSPVGHSLPGGGLSIPMAVEKGKEGAGRIRNQMEARAAYVPGQPQEEGPGNVEVLADWAASWRRRVYGIAPPIQAGVGGANLSIDGGGTGSNNRN